MKTIYLVCAWYNFYHYYPDGRDENVKAIFASQEEAELFLKEFRTRSRFDNYEIRVREILELSLDKSE